MIRKTAIFFSIFSIFCILYFIINITNKRDSEKFVFEFQSNFDGEDLYIKSSVPCHFETSKISNTSSENIEWYDMPRTSFGKEISDGRGVFVAVPDVCLWYLKSEHGNLTWSGDLPYQPVSPLIYFTDNYTNPTEVQVFLDPEYLENKVSGERRFSRVWKINDPVDSKIQYITPNSNDPFKISKGTTWFYFVLVPIDLDNITDNVYTKTTDIYSDSLLRVYEVDRPIDLGEKFDDWVFYFQNIQYAHPSDKIIETRIRHKYRSGEKESNALLLELIDISKKIIPIRFSDNKIYLADKEDGIYIYPGSRSGYANESFNKLKKYYSIWIGSIEVKF